jgi:DNA (cytosine-5)-methyltransferase 1
LQSIEEGYRLLGGKLSYDIAHIIDTSKPLFTLVATDAVKFALVDNSKLRRLTEVEGLRLMGFPDNWFDTDVSYTKAFDLLGNSVCVQIIEMIADRLIK